MIESGATNAEADAPGVGDAFADEGGVLANVLEGDAAALEDGAGLALDAAFDEGALLDEHAVIAITPSNDATLPRPQPPNARRRMAADANPRSPTRGRVRRRARSSRRVDAPFGGARSLPR